MALEDVTIGISVEDVVEGAEYKVLGISQKQTQFGMRYIAVMKREGIKWELWLSDVDLKKLKRYLLTTATEDVEGLILTLKTEKYVNKLGEEKDAVRLDTIRGEKL